MILVDEGVGSIASVEYVFKVLAATYGAAWDKSLGTAPIGQVMTVWANALDGFTDSAQARKSIIWALNSLPPTCPNAIQFRNLCRSAPMPQAPKLPEPEPDPARLSAEMAKLRGMLAAKPAEPAIGVAWARRIMARVAAGEKVATATQAFAREALARKGCADGREVGHA